MEVIKYVIAVAVGAFATGIAAIEFIDNRIQSKISPYILENTADGRYVHEPFSERVLELQAVVDALGQHRNGPTFSVNNPRVGGTTTGECPEGSYVSSITVTKGVGGRYAVDGISEITFKCSALK